MPIEPIPELLFIDELVAVGEDPRPIRRAARAGHYVRVRRGIYCRRAEWDDASDRTRHIARSRAVFAQIRLPALAAGYSAAALHDLAVLRPWPTDVTLLVPYRGGGTAEPGVIRTAARWRDGHAALASGVPVTTVERTLFDIVLIDGFAGGVATIDSALRSSLTDIGALASVLDEWRPRTGGRRCAQALAFATSRSGSFGESLARAVIHQLGFPPPLLQQRFEDDQGVMFVDFFWPEFGVVCEFDGKVKYTREEFTGGDPGDVAWREKLREDRLRRLVRTVVRLNHDHVRDPRSLAALLEQAGVRRGQRYLPEDTGARVSFSR